MPAAFARGPRPEAGGAVADAGFRGARWVDRLHRLTSSSRRPDHSVLGRPATRIPPLHAMADRVIQLARPGRNDGAAASCGDDRAKKIKTLVPASGKMDGPGTHRGLSPEPPRPGQARKGPAKGADHGP